MAGPGVRFNEQMAGWIAVPRTDRGDTGPAWLRLRAAVIIEDLDRFLADPGHRGALLGHVDFEPLGRDIPATGHVELFAAGPTAGSRVMRYQATFTAAGVTYEMIGTKYVTNAAGYNVWGHTTTLFTTVWQKGPQGSVPLAAGVIRLTLWQGVRLLLTLRGTAAGELASRSRAVLRFMAFFVGQVGATYLPMGKGNP